MQFFNPSTCQIVAEIKRSINFAKCLKFSQAGLSKRTVVFFISPINARSTNRNELITQTIIQLTCILLYAKPDILKINFFSSSRRKNIGSQISRFLVYSLVSREKYPHFRQLSTSHGISTTRSVARRSSHKGVRVRVKKYEELGEVGEGRCHHFENGALA